MQLMQWNYFLENGLLSFDDSTGRLTIHYEQYHPVVKSFLRNVLSVQHEGDIQKANELVDRWFYWKDDLHEVIASRIRESLTYRYRLVRYGALGEE